MKLNDSNAVLPSDQRPFRVLLIAGSNRRQYNCPGVDSKSRSLLFRMAENLPQDWEIDMSVISARLGSLRDLSIRRNPSIVAQRINISLIGL